MTRRRGWYVLLGLGALGGLATLLRRREAAPPIRVTDGTLVAAVPGAVPGAVPSPKPGRAVAAVPDGASPSRPGWGVAAVPGEGPAEPPPEPEVFDVREWIAAEPTVDRLYLVRRGDTFGGRGPRSLIYQALLRRAREVARAAGWSDQWAEAVASDSRNRIAYLDLLQCGGWNDLVYGTWGYGSGAHASPHGRAIRLVRQHADNVRRLAEGDAPLRLIQMRSPADKGRGNAYAIDPMLKEAYELLWFPDIDDEALRDGRITAEGLEWSDGSSRLWPPPEIVVRGVDVLDDPALSTYGCRTDGADGRLVV